MDGGERRTDLHDLNARVSYAAFRTQSTLRPESRTGSPMMHHDRSNLPPTFDLIS